MKTTLVCILCILSFGCNEGRSAVFALSVVPSDDVQYDGGSLTSHLDSTGVKLRQALVQISNLQNETTSLQASLAQAIAEIAVLQAELASQASTNSMVNQRLSAIEEEQEHRVRSVELTSTPTIEQITSVFSDIPNRSGSFILLDPPGTVLVSYSDVLTFSTIANNLDTVEFRIVVDGQPQPDVYTLASSTWQSIPIQLRWAIGGISSGAHTISVQAQITSFHGGSAQVGGSNHATVSVDEVHVP